MNLSNTMSKLTRLGLEHAGSAGIFAAAWLSTAAYAVNDLPGGPAVNQLNLHPAVTRIAAGIGAVEATAGIDAERDGFRGDGHAGLDVSAIGNRGRYATAVECGSCGIGAKGGACGIALKAQLVPGALKLGNGVALLGEGHGETEGIARRTVVTRYDHAGLRHHNVFAGVAQEAAGSVGSP